MSIRRGMSRSQFLAWVAVSVITSVLGRLFLGGDSPSQALAGTQLGQAFDQTKDSDRLVIADFEADWCQWCQKMDETTWADAGVVQLVQEHGLLVKVDVMADPALAAAYSINAYPTVVVFQDGKEVDRKVGYIQVRAMRQWLEKLER